MRTSLLRLKSATVAPSPLVGRTLVPLALTLLALMAVGCQAGDRAAESPAASAGAPKAPVAPAEGAKGSSLEAPPKPSEPATRNLVYEELAGVEGSKANWKRGEGEGGPGEWKWENGWIVGENVHNDALWLDAPVPLKSRVEFEVEALTPTGDIKVEIYGDGKKHQSGYVLIFGGWKNTLDVIARLDEHGKDRKERPSRKVETGRVYRMAIERREQGRLDWYVDDAWFMSYEDPKPLAGDGHTKFALNVWQAPVRFRNIRIYAVQ